MPSGQEVFEARLRRIANGHQIQGEGLAPIRPPRISRKRRRRSGLPGKALMVVFLALGGFTGAVASGHGPEGLDRSTLLVWTAQLQSDLVGLIAPAAAEAAGIGAGILS